MIFWCALLFGAFEFVGLGGPAGAMLAGGAVPDWRHGLSLNPALADPGPGVGIAAAYCRPYGLDGLGWGQMGAHWRARALGLSLAVSSLTLGFYREENLQVCIAAMPAHGVWTGVGLHALALEMGREGRDVVPALDVGGCCSFGRFTAGAGLSRLNVPRWRDGSELPARLVLSGAWRPVESLLLALDACREGRDERGAFGVEFRIIPEAGLRFGVATGPLRYAGGVGARAGPVTLDYAWQFHPQLNGTHSIGLAAAWP